MSAHRSWTIICDACEETIDDGTLGAETAAEGRRMAKGDGAHVNLPGGRDICSDCWKDGAR